MVSGQIAATRSSGESRRASEGGAESPLRISRIGHSVRSVIA